MTPVPISRIEKIKRLAEAGHTRKEIAEITGQAMTNVCRVIKKHNINCRYDQRPHPPTYWTPERIAELDRLRDSGKTMSECAVLMKSSKDVCRQVYNRNGCYKKYPKRGLQ